MKHFNRTVTVLVFIFLYIPMIVLGIASFNAGTDIATFKGFTLSQYANLFRDSALLRLLLNSLIIAVLSTLAATVFGTMAAVGPCEIIWVCPSNVVTSIFPSKPIGTPSMIKIKPTTKANGNKIRVQLFTSNAQKLPKSRVVLAAIARNIPANAAIPVAAVIN